MKLNILTRAICNARHLKAVKKNALEYVKESKHLKYV
jgi:hypothetical protein